MLGRVLGEKRKPERPPTKVGDTPFNASFNALAADRPAASKAADNFPIGVFRQGL